MSLVFFDFTAGWYIICILFKGSSSVRGWTLVGGLLVVAEHLLVSHVAVVDVPANKLAKFAYDLDTAHAFLVAGVLPRQPAPTCGNQESVAPDVVQPVLLNQLCEAAHCVHLTIARVYLRFLQLKISPGQLRQSTLHAHPMPLLLEDGHGQLAQQDE